jgi:hypothetical protein
MLYSTKRFNAAFIPETSPPEQSMAIFLRFGI